MIHTAGDGTMQKKIRLAVEELAVVTFETERKISDHELLEAEMISGAALTCRTCPTKVNTCCTP